MKKIPLTQNKVALVDDEDYPKLSEHKWFAIKDRNSYFYAVRTSSKKFGLPRHIRMHRKILGLGQGDRRQGDHINHNTLDNRRSNLRICTKQENCCNRQANKKSTSKYLGVDWDSKAKKWRAQISIQRKKIFLGYFKFEELAALAYDFAALKYHREFANFNF